MSYRQGDWGEVNKLQPSGNLVFSVWYLILGLVKCYPITQLHTHLFWCSVWTEKVQGLSIQLESLQKAALQNLVDGHDKRIIINISTLLMIMKMKHKMRHKSEIYKLLKILISPQCQAFQLLSHFSWCFPPKKRILNLKLGIYRRPVSVTDSPLSIPTL